MAWIRITILYKKVWKREKTKDTYRKYDWEDEEGNENDGQDPNSEFPHGSDYKLNDPLRKIKWAA